ncbi:MAG: M48 family metallopeptidase [Alphaproteobacteria bacterium]|nr:M48 family metallopeptidase [Alphaproteobacteria bacterium]
MIELPPHIQIKHSARARRVALRLDPIERVFHLVVPKGVSMRKAAAFAEGQERWMQEKLSALPPKVSFAHGTIIPILGQRSEIRVHYEPDLKVTKILLEDGILHVRTNKDDPSGRIERFLKAMIKDELSILSHEKVARIGKTISSVSVRDTKSRWGSCSSDNALSYSWRLVFAPPEAFDYVVAHEVAHLRHLNHSKQFWDLCAQLSDQYDEGKYWMKAHGNELMRYG